MWIIKGGRRLFFSLKTKHLAITKGILQKITYNPATSAEECNIDAVFKIGWAGFLRLGEITYTSAKLKGATFSSIYAVKSDISFAGGNQYAIVGLK